MTRKQLEELGLTKEQADKVIEINGADIENAKTDLKSTVKTLEKDKEELQKQITDRDSQLETLKKSAGDNESLSRQIADLQAANKTAKEDYEALIAIYNNKSFSGKITDIVKTKIDTKFSGIKNNILNISEKIVEKLPAPFSKIFELKKSLTKLENINKSVDELMRLNIPYGENINKYEQLSRYIIKANSIQSEISNYIKKS